MPGDVILTSRIPEIVAGAEKRGHAVVEKSVNDIEAAAKARLYAYPAVDTSALVDSGEAVSDGYEGEVGFGTDHSNFVEFGTGARGEESHFPGKPDHITYTSDWAGMAAQPYLIPSVEEQRAPFEMAIGQLYS